MMLVAEQNKPTAHAWLLSVAMTERKSPTPKAEIDIGPPQVVPASLMTVGFAAIVSPAAHPSVELIIQTLEFPMRELRQRSLRAANLS